MTGKIDLETFMAQTKPGGDAGRKSMLEDYASEINTLRKKEYTIDQICLYLKQAHDIDAKRSTVASFLNRKNIKKTRSAPQQTEQPPQNVATEKEEKISTPAETKPTQPAENLKSRMETQAGKY